MPTLFPRPATPGAVSAADLDAVRELHAICRQWAEPVSVHLPYLDLTFAFGFAILGDANTSRRLLEDARAVLERPAPATAVSPEHLQRTAALVHTFLFQLLQFRTEQLLSGQPHTGSMSGEVRAAYDEIARQAEAGSVCNPQKLAQHAINVFRMVSRIAEPVENVDPYDSWSKAANPVKQEVVELQAVRDPAEFTNRLRRLCDAHIRGEQVADKRAMALRDALNMVTRADGEFAAELVGLALEELANAIGDISRHGGEFLTWQQCRGLERALFVAAHIGRADLTGSLAELFGELVNRFPHASRFQLIGTAGTQCLRSLRALGLRDEIERLVARLRTAIGDRPPDPHNSDTLLGFRPSRLILAVGWLLLGSDAEAAPLLDEARQVLLAPGVPRLPSKDYTELASAYVSALGEGPADTGFPRVGELFREMPPYRITSTFTTAPYFSRLHLILTEEAVAAVCRMLAEPRARFSQQG